MSEKLANCPFCGGEAKHNDGGNSVYGRFWWAVWCDECEIEMRDREVWKHEGDRTVLALPAKECFDRWNRRHQEQDQSSTFERMMSK
ncbi:Lar family restriction alleviation protein [Ensifer adhaerens]|uniref:Lar family restriction alleviation protein n=1 Tax=Ensifer adhaerens TaxID=106592 RepID=UPI000CF1898A|nr:Lar family restriction alleviation protein [Ensifer adhaerens]